MSRLLDWIENVNYPFLWGALTGVAICGAWLLLGWAIGIK
jgi:hypothetical protein